MVGIVIVSHSNKVAEGVKEIAFQMAPEVNIIAAGGTSDGRIGTDMAKIQEAIRGVYSKSGVIVLFDLGSAFMNTEMAVEFLDEDMKNNVEIIDAPLVEGTIVAAVESSIGKNIYEIKELVKKIYTNEG
jgi:dihydroxyacetone kinase phosphotransfer subunit